MELASIVPHFDCRMGSYASWEEARALLMWRAYDCSVNGVADAVYQMPGSGKKVQSLGKREKIAWLFSRNSLPLPRHQAYGTVVTRMRRMSDGYNPKTQETTQVLRSVVEDLPAAVLQLAVGGLLDTEPLTDGMDTAAAGAAAYALAQAGGGDIAHDALCLPSHAHTPSDCLRDDQTASSASSALSALSASSASSASLASSALLASSASSALLASSASSALSASRTCKHSDVSLSLDEKVALAASIAQEVTKDLVRFAVASYFMLTNM